MASPNRMPTIRIGSRLKIGLPDGAGIRSSAQPSWKTPTVTPKAVPSDSRNPSVPTSGTSSDRNKITNRTRDRLTTRIK